MQKQTDPWWDIIKMIGALLALVFFFALVTDFPRATALPDIGGGWFYHYQNLFAGLLAALGGFLAYKGMREQINSENHFRKSKSYDLLMKFELDSRILRNFIPLLYSEYSGNFAHDTMMYFSDGVFPNDHEVYHEGNEKPTLGKIFYNEEIINLLSSAQREDILNIIELYDEFINNGQDYILDTSEKPARGDYLRSLKQLHFKLHNTFNIEIKHTLDRQPDFDKPIVPRSIKEFTK